MFEKNQFNIFFKLLVDFFQVASYYFGKHLVLRFSFAEHVAEYTTPLSPPRAFFILFF